MPLFKKKEQGFRKDVVISEDSYGKYYTDDVGKDFERWKNKGGLIVTGGSSDQYIAFDVSDDGQGLDKKLFASGIKTSDGLVNILNNQVTGVPEAQQKARENSIRDLVSAEGHHDLAIQSALGDVATWVQTDDSVKLPNGNIEAARLDIAVLNEQGGMELYSIMLSGSASYGGDQYFVKDGKVLPVNDNENLKHDSKKLTEKIHEHLKTMKPKEMHQWLSGLVDNGANSKQWKALNAVTKGGANFTTLQASRVALENGKPKISMRAQLNPELQKNKVSKKLKKIEISAKKLQEEHDKGEIDRQLNHLKRSYMRLTKEDADESWDLETLKDKIKDGFNAIDESDLFGIPLGTGDTESDTIKGIKEKKGSKEELVEAYVEETLKGEFPGHLGQRAIERYKKKQSELKAVSEDLPPEDMSDSEARVAEHAPDRGLEAVGSEPVPPKKFQVNTEIEARDKVSELKVKGKPVHVRLKIYPSDKGPKRSVEGDKLKSFLLKVLDGLKDSKVDLKLSEGMHKSEIKPSEVTVIKPEERASFKTYLETVGVKPGQGLEGVITGMRSNPFFTEDEGFSDVPSRTASAALDEHAGTEEKLEGLADQGVDVDGPKSGQGL